MFKEEKRNGFERLQIDSNYISKHKQPNEQCSIVAEPCCDNHVVRVARFVLFVRLSISQHSASNKPIEKLERTLVQSSSLSRGASKSTTARDSCDQIEQDELATIFAQLFQPTTTTKLNKRIEREKSQ